MAKPTEVPAEKLTWHDFRRYYRFRDEHAGASMLKYTTGGRPETRNELARPHTEILGSIWGVTIEEPTANTDGIVRYSCQKKDCGRCGRKYG